MQREGDAGFNPADARQTGDHTGFVRAHDGRESAQRVAQAAANGEVTAQCGFGGRDERIVLGVQKAKIGHSIGGIHIQPALAAHTGGGGGQSVDAAGIQGQWLGLVQHDVGIARCPVFVGDLAGPGCPVDGLCLYARRAHRSSGCSQPKGQAALSPRPSRCPVQHVMSPSEMERHPAWQQPGGGGLLAGAVPARMWE